MKDDGGPAFPPPWVVVGDQHALDVEEALTEATPQGMTLRDWFAGQALQGFCAADADVDRGSWRKAYAEMAYETADAMLKARDE